MRTFLFCWLLAGVLAGGGAAAESMNDDPYLWLEEVEGEKALDWAREQSGQAMAGMEADPAFVALRADILAILESGERIPYVNKMGEHVYNFWRDANQRRGLWRRTSLEEYRKAEPAWETVLDLDALAAAEGENWVWGGANCRAPAYDRCLISLSRGGADARVVREFDLADKAFVEGGFELPEAKSNLSWVDRDHVFVGTDFGDGSLTTSGYPRVARLWRRGTELAEASTVFEGEVSDVAAGMYQARTRAIVYQFAYRAVGFFTREYHLRGEDGGLTRIDVPNDAELGAAGEHMLIELKSDWETGGRTWAQGSLLTIPLKAFLDGGRDFTALYTPGPRKSLSGYTVTANFIIVNELDNVVSRLYEWKHDGKGWKQRAIDAPLASLSAFAIDSESSDDYFLNVSSFVEPDALYLASAGHDRRELLKSLPAFYDATGLRVSQHEAVSTDGSRIPYFQIAREDLALDGDNPTLLYGYGGFEVSQRPSYSAAVGRGWLEAGGAFVVANIRGGGEFGPAWHRAGLKENRQRVFDDFIAVAEDLVERKVTRPARLGIRGGSNGGLLTGVMLTQRPDLFGAVVIQVPLLDMRRYHLLLAGASWMAEYGNPDDPAEWAYISQYSPYQKLDAQAKYPPTLVTTSTRDDRVHPGHARKFVARMLEHGQPVTYYENIEGGHGGAADNPQQAKMQALIYTWLKRQLFPAE
ncbi:MAG TPA: prolyl oligopeptidase family serine peptidase [Xanthomonadaceae bacterium]|nr:prolyl oligopeptidase family serine peptidase [Xanthomonadaceae bacterium]